MVTTTQLPQYQMRGKCFKIFPKLIYGLFPVADIYHTTDLEVKKILLRKCCPFLTMNKELITCDAQ